MKNGCRPIPGARLATLVVTSLALLPSAVAAAQAPTVDEIVNRTNAAAYYQGADGRAQGTLTIEDRQGRVQRRQFTVLRRNDVKQSGELAGGEQRYYIYFHRPADVARTGFLVWKHPGRADDRWLYLPALDLIKRLAAADTRTSFVGSHFFYEDVSGRDTDEDEHRLVETTDTYFVLENLPKDPRAVEFVSYRMWIHRDTFLPVKVEYYDERGDPYRVYEALEVRTIDGHPTVVGARMRDDRIGGQTTLRYSGVGYDLGLAEEIFTERFLRNPPVELLQ